MTKAARRTWRKAAGASCALACLAGIAGCKATYPEGKIACDTASDCPAGWYCLPTGGSGLCYSSKDGLPGRNDEDAAVMDDAGRSDGGTRTDAGDASAGDAGAGDAGVDAGNMSRDPCDTDNGGCDALVTCSSDATTVTCGACPDGYDDTNGDGTSCADIDECATDNGGCGDAAYRTCTNNVGDAPTCADIDECATNNGDCGDAAYYSCTNNEGAAATCGDVNECSGANICAADYPCENLIPYYTCRGQFADWTPTDSPTTFTVNGDGTVTDARSGLVWQQAVDTGQHTWAGAKAYCAGLSLAGTGWRLPALAELESIVDFGRYNPALDPAAFPSTPGTAFWSSSAYVGSSGYAWDVVFDGGKSEYSGTGAVAPVRCVR